MPQINDTGGGKAKKKLPTDAELSATAQRVAQTFMPGIARLLGLPAPSHPPIFVISRKATGSTTGYGVLGYANGNEIHVSRKYVTEHPGDFQGLLVHELTHYVMGVAAPSVPYTDQNKWLIEGLADYAAHTLVGTQKSPHAHPGRPRGGYQGAADFLVWMEHRKPGSVQALTQVAMTPQLQAQGAQAAILGEPFANLISEYRSARGLPAAGSTHPLNIDPMVQWGIADLGYRANERRREPVGTGATLGGAVMPYTPEAPLPQYQRGSGPTQLPYGQAARANRVAHLGITAPIDEQQFNPQTPQEKFIFDATHRPGEPLTSGAPFGPGANSVPVPFQSDTQMLQSVVMQMASDPAAPSELKAFAERVARGE